MIMNKRNYKLTRKTLRNNPRCTLQTVTHTTENAIHICLSSPFNPLFSLYDYYYC